MLKELERPEVQKIYMKVVKPELTLDEMKKLHPLVTEERFLNLNYWPDITPKCFADLDA